MKRISLIMGHYGSGKTEFAINCALREKAADPEKKISMIDFDIANPYFRSRERQQLLKEAGIDIEFNAFGFDISEDLPAISAGIRAPLEDKSCRVIVDVGGNDTGAMVVKPFMKYFTPDVTEVLLVVNASRTETADLEGALRHMREIQTMTGLAVTGLINNTHLLMETEAAHIMNGHDLCRQITEATGIPLCFDTCREDLAAEVTALAESEHCSDLKLFPMQLIMRPSWLDCPL